MILANGRITLAQAPVKRATALAALALVASCALTACGDDSSSGAANKNDGVASMVSSSPSTTAGTAKTGPLKESAADAKRPQLRLDSSAAEITKYRQVYSACLREHENGSTTAKAAALAAKACEDKMPLLPPEMDPQKNPHYADAVRVQVKCMRDHGFKVHVVPATGSDPNAISWTYDSVPGPGVDIEKIQDDCRVKGFGGGRELRPGPV